MCISTLFFKTFIKLIIMFYWILINDRIFVLLTLVNIEIYQNDLVVDTKGNKGI